MRVETHWTQKTLAQMGERDWRIFREDHNIAYRGSSNHVLPVRSWDEAELPKPIRQARARARAAFVFGCSSVFWGTGLRPPLRAALPCTPLSSLHGSSLEEKVSVPPANDDHKIT